jgi:S-DNA-T family DNA segregation ATPase FtsK/SpoIIIE
VQGSDPHAATGGPAAIGVLPSTVPVHSLPGPTVADGQWTVPVGIGDADLGPAALVLHATDHVLVTGRPRTGRTSALALVADRWRAAAMPGPVAVVAYRPSALCRAADGVVVTHAADLARLAPRRGPALVLVDDAELVDDDGTLRALLAAARPGLHVVAAGHPDALRSQYGHWTQLVRRSRLGVLLQPDAEVDGALLGAVLPRRTHPAPRPGRGYVVVDGQAELVQLAQAPAPPTLGA